MKRYVVYSRSAWLLTVGLSALLCGTVLGLLLLCEERWLVLSWSILVVVMLGVSLYYAPMRIVLEDDALRIERSLRIKAIPLALIGEVRPYRPACAAVSLCGSGGFLGYWGWFAEKGLGRYFAYYGRKSDCFLVTLKDGRKYVLGCREASDLVGALGARNALGCR